jgi:hypothetical protein
MNLMSKILSTEIKALNGFNFLVAKVLRLGQSDVQSGFVSAPFGYDGNPTKGYRAIFSDTGNAGEPVILNFISRKNKAQIGEVRLHSEASNGDEKAYIYLRADGKFELLGNANFSVKFNELETAFNKLKKSFNDFASVYTPGSPSTLGTPPSISQCDADISNAKNENILTI